MQHERVPIPRVLYLAYWGAAEPLGQSLLLPAVHQLARSGVRLVLVTFEKPADLTRDAEMARIRSELQEQGVPWVPLRYHKRPKIPATAFDLFQGCARSLMVRLRFPFNIVHARTYVGGLMGLALSQLLRAKFIYHNEGFYPDEQVDGGVWQAGSLPHRIAKKLERCLYTAADGIIALSHRARLQIDNLPPVRRKRTPTIVVPSCVDLEKFRWHTEQKIHWRDQLRLVYIGSIGYRYLFERIARFVAAAARELGPVRLRVLTGADPTVVDATLRQAGLPVGSWSVQAVPHSAVASELVTQDAGLFFLTQGLSEHGCSPTKIGEYWAMGLPVVTTPNVSDTDEIIRCHKVGVIVREHSETAYRRAAMELRSLLEDPDLARRCRDAAEIHYGLDDACEKQAALYGALLSGMHRSVPISLSAIRGAP